MDVNIPAIVDEVTTAFRQYEQALTGNDVATLDALFWASRHVVRYGATENLYGQEQILAFRKARPSKGLDRSLRNTVITTFGTDFATANTEFTRPGSDRIGRQSHSWARLPEGWRIVAAHVSWMDDPRPG
jgi:ketosteroid isomerase-like protein